MYSIRSCWVRPFRLIDCILIRCRLSDWLVDRKQCVADWAPRANTIQDKVAVAVAALPEDDEDLHAIVKESQCMFMPIGPLLLY